MALIDFQTALGRTIRDKNNANALRGLHLSASEQSLLLTLKETAGFRVTVDIQRSWCIGRAAKAAYLTLSILPEDERRRLLDTWADSGAGTHSFYSAEADAFLDFIAHHLPDPSHALTLCKFERATLRANNGAERFKTPDLSRLHSPECVLCRGRCAGLVRFHAEPDQVLAAVLENKPLPPVSADGMTMLFGPGLPQLCRPASSEEANVLDRLATPASIKVLLSEGHRLEALESLLEAGAVEYCEDTEAPFSPI